MQTIFTTPDVIAHFAAMHPVLASLSSAATLEAEAYSLDHLDAMSALLCAAAMANKVTGNTIKTFTEFTRFLGNCDHIAKAMALDIPKDKCIHELTAYLFCEIMGEVDGDEGLDHGEGHTLN